MLFVGIFQPILCSYEWWTLSLSVFAFVLGSIYAAKRKKDAITASSWVPFSASGTCFKLRKRTMPMMAVRGDDKWPVAMCPAYTIHQLINFIRCVLGDEGSTPERRAHLYLFVCFRQWDMQSGMVMSRHKMEISTSVCTLLNGYVRWWVLCWRTRTTSRYF